MLFRVIGLGCVLIGVGLLTGTTVDVLMNSAEAAPQPAALAVYTVGGTEQFPMESDLVLDFSPIGMGVVSGRFMGMIDMTHSNAHTDTGGPAGPDLVDLTINSLTQAFGGFTITSVQPAGGQAASNAMNSNFPASSLLTVTYTMTTPFAPPNNVLNGVHTLQATVNDWPPTDIYAGTMPSMILRGMTPVGTLSVPAHGMNLGSGIPTMQATAVMLLGALLLILGVWVLRRRDQASPTLAG
jgi:hypothetical protein